MNQNRRKQRNKNEKRMKTKVIRCGLLKHPVFEHESCPKFVPKTDVDSIMQKNCKNCRYSF